MGADPHISASLVVLLALLAAMTRLLPLAWVASSFGFHFVPWPIRIMILAAIALPFTGDWPVGAAVPTGAPLRVHWAHLGWLLARELGIGAVFAVVSSAVWWAVRDAGRLVGHAWVSGLSSTHHDPNEGVFASLYEWVAIVTFVSLGGLTVAIRAFARTFEIVPLGSVAMPGIATSHTQVPFGLFAWTAAHALAAAIQLSVMLALPALLSAAWVVLLFGALSRVVAPVAASTVATVQSAVVLGGVWLGMRALVETLAGSMPSLFERALRTLDVLRTQ
jgi:type III secretory pathway component EscT